MSEPDVDFDAYYAQEDDGESECIVVRLGSIFDGVSQPLDIRDAVYFRYLLDGAINDYERAVGR